MEVIPVLALILIFIYFIVAIQNPKKHILGLIILGFFAIFFGAAGSACAKNNRRKKW